MILFALLFASTTAVQLRQDDLDVTDVAMYSDVIAGGDDSFAEAAAPKQEEKPVVKKEEIKKPVKKE